MKQNPLSLSVPIARPPWTKLGKKLESMFRKALYDFNMLEKSEKIAVALSGGKDSLTLLYLLHSISGRGFPEIEIEAIHVSGEVSCGASISENFLQAICKELQIPFTVCYSSLKQGENLECYSCSRERRKIIFEEAKKRGITKIAFGHHREDSIQTLLMNLFHKGEFAANLPKVPMYDYGVTIIRPLIYISEKEIKEFAKLYGFSRIVCQCPIGQKSMRKKIEKILCEIEEVFPNIRENLSLASFTYGSNKALKRNRKNQ